MKTLNHIGLNQEKTQKLASNLNNLLANYSIFYQNIRGFHWKIKGRNFFELHIKFEELYNDLFVKIDDVAERILTLGGNPEHNFTKYVSKSNINEFTQEFDGEIAVKEILKSFKVLITMQREILEEASQINDEGTTALMSDYIREQEKLVWMYQAFLA